METNPDQVLLGTCSMFGSGSKRWTRFEPDLIGTQAHELVSELADLTARNAGLQEQ